MKRDFRKILSSRDFQESTIETTSPYTVRRLVAESQERKDSPYPRHFPDVGLRPARFHNALHGMPFAQLQNACDFMDHHMRKRLFRSHDCDRWRRSNGPRPGCERLRTSVPLRALCSRQPALAVSHWLGRPNRHESTKYRPPRTGVASAPSAGCRAVSSALS
jgi:hypothetical protein